MKREKSFRNNRKIFRPESEWEKRCDFGRKNGFKERGTRVFR